MTVAVKPSQLFLDLLSALRAVDGEVHASHQQIHEGSQI